MNQRDTSEQQSTNAGIDGVLFRRMMISIIVGAGLQGFIASWVTAPIVTGAITFVVLVFSGRVAKAGLDFSRVRPIGIMRFSTLFLVWFAFVCCLALVLWSVYQVVSNASFLGGVTLLSGIALWVAPMSILRSKSRS